MILDTETLALPSWAALLVVMLCAGVILRRDLELITGIYCSQGLWLTNIMVGKVSLTWFWVATIGAVALLRARNKDAVLENPVLLWVVLWGAWILAVSQLLPGDPVVVRGLIRNLILYICLPIVPVLLFPSDPASYWRFVTAFAAVTVIGGAAIFFVLNASLGNVFLYDPLSPQLYRLGRVNYHQYAAAFVIGFVFLIARLYRSRNVVVRIALLLPCAFLAYLTVLSTSREATTGLILSILLFVVWGFWRHRQSRLLTLVILGLCVAIASYLVRFGPLLERFSADRMATLGERTLLWQESWQAFVGSPLWGQGFVVYNLAHNLFLEALLTTGVVGFVFILMFLIPVLRAAWRLVLRWQRGPASFDEELVMLALIIAFIYALYAAQFVGNLLHGFPIYWAGVMILQSVRGARLESVAERSGAALLSKPQHAL